MLAAILVAVLSSTLAQEPVGHGRAEVETVLTEALPALAACNTAAFKSTATFDFAITEAGAVDDVMRVVHVDDALHIRLIEPCLSQVVRGLSFPARSAAHVRFGFELLPQATVRRVLVLSPSTAEVVLASSVSPDVRAAVAPLLAELTDCYQTVLRISPSVAGSVVFAHSIGVDGVVVDDAVVETQAPDAILHVPLKACLRRVLRQAHYEVRSDGAATAVVALRCMPAAAASLDAIDRALTTQATAITACLVDKRRPSPFAFSIDHDGRAHDVSGELETLTCLRTAVEATRWPAPGTGSVRVSTTARASGGLARSEIQNVVTAALPRIKNCYDVELAKRHIEGTLTMHYTIDGDGAVIDVKTLHPFKPGAVELTDEQVVACVTAVIRAGHYPQPKGGGLVHVTYPFVFASP